MLGFLKIHVFGGYENIFEFSVRNHEAFTAVLQSWNPLPTTQLP